MYQMCLCCLLRAFEVASDKMIEDGFLIFIISLIDFIKYKLLLEGVLFTFCEFNASVRHQAQVITGSNDCIIL